MNQNNNLNPISINSELISLSQTEVEKLIHIFLESKEIQKSYCSKCHSWQCCLETIEGSVCFNVNLFPSEISNQVIVEFQRISGSSLIFGTIFRDFKSKREESFSNQNEENINLNQNNNILIEHEYGSSEAIERLQIQDPPSLTSQESEKAIEALRYWLSFDPLEAATVIECLQDPDVSTIPSFKLLKMEAIREKIELTGNDSTKLEHNHSICDFNIHSNLTTTTTISQNSNET